MAGTTRLPGDFPSRTLAHKWGQEGVNIAFDKVARTVVVVDFDVSQALPVVTPAALSSGLASAWSDPVALANGYSPRS